jgi:Tol biopolymer transport system component
MFIRYAPLLLLVILSIMPVSAIGETQVVYPGRIAYVGTDYNVYTHEFANENTYAISNDGGIVRGYQWPTWSTDGRLAFFCCDSRVMPQSLGQIYLSTDGYSAAENIYSQEDISVIYAYWSPQNCQDGANCRDLALLVNDLSRNGLALHLLRTRDTNTSLQHVEFGSPFYYHWNPSGTQMVFHRNNSEVAIYDVSNERFIDSAGRTSSGLYQTPAWSPIDDRQLYGIQSDDGRSTDLVIVDGDRTSSLLTSVRGFLSFAWSPDGRYIAYRVFSSSGISPIHIFDVQSGEVIATTPTEGALAFFWSPDSQKLAYVTPPVRSAQSAGDLRSSDRLLKPSAQNQPEIRLFWNIYTIADDSNIVLSEFIPTYEMGYLLTYFDQFSPSHRIWSPDSQAIVYASLDGEGTGQSSIYIASIDSGREPLLVSDGVFAVWSFE